MALTFAQIEAVAEKAGATPSEAATLAAISMAESGGNPTSLNDNPGTGDLSYGLWQINMLGSMGTNRQQEWGLSSYSDLFDPVTNAKAALSVLRDQGWNAWTTYTSGAYTKYLSGAQSALSSTGKVDVSTLSSDTGGALGTPKQQSVSDYLNDPAVVSQYGYLAAYLKDPVLGPILAKAAQQGWNSGELLSALQKTTWWKTMSATKRQLQEQQREDPATYNEEWITKHSQVKALADSLGIQLTRHQLGQITTTAMWSNWSDQQLQSAIGSEFHYQPGKAYLGQAGSDIQQFKAMADNYLVPLADKTLGQWTQAALQGRISPKDYTGYLAQQAKTLFPWMSHAIDSGIDPNSYLDPYRQAAAKTLELDPSQINFMDPKWMSLFQTVDAKTGQRSEFGLANALNKMRTDPKYGYDKTLGARNQAASFAASLAHEFGFVGSDSALAGVQQPGF